MKRLSKEERRARSDAFFGKYTPIFIGVCLLFCLVLLFNGFRLYRTANAVLQTATASVPEIVWYEEMKPSQSAQPQDAPTGDVSQSAENTAGETVYVLNTSSMRIHSPTCRYAQTMQSANKQTVNGKTLEELQKEGYSICSVCHAQ